MELIPFVTVHSRDMGEKHLSRNFKEGSIEPKIMSGDIFSNTWNWYLDGEKIWKKEHFGYIVSKVWKLDNFSATQILLESECRQI